VAEGTRILIWLMYPLVLLSEKLSQMLARGRATEIFRREEFTAMASIGAHEGQLDERESHILRNLFRFPSLKARDIMTPRTVVFALRADMTVNEVMGAHPEMAFSRIPIYGENRDDITGFVLSSDILLAQARDQHDARLHSLKRDIRRVLDKTSLSRLFEILLGEQEHILLVVDEYGGLQGIVSLEDLVETLLGLEIVDEADRATDMQALARAKWEKRAQKLGLPVDRHDDR
jgi:CBS domain containing-hemolysin-like protein